MKKLGIVAQVKLSLKRRNALATLIGVLFGGFVPLAIYVTAHSAGFGWNAESSTPLGLVFGGLCYSAQTVYQWAKMAFDNAVKAAGFSLLLEGVMCTTHTHWLALLALGYLIAINAVATGCNLSIGARR